MDRSSSYRELRFDPAIRAIPRRLFAVGLGAGVFALIWWLIPAGTIFWLLLFAVVCLVWVASYGWRQALAALVAFLHRLEGA